MSGKEKFINKRVIYKQMDLTLNKIIIPTLKNIQISWDDMEHLNKTINQNVLLKILKFCKNLFIMRQPYKGPSTKTESYFYMQIGNISKLKNKKVAIFFPKC